MIKIINVGATSGKEAKNLAGERLYEIYINDILFTRFSHTRSNGLGDCLFEASKAVEKQKWKDAMEIFIGGENDTKRV